MPEFPILQIEDDEHDVFFLKRAFQDAAITNPLHVVHDGQEAIDYLSGAGKFADRRRYPLPGLVLLDLKLPRRDGLEVLQWLKNDPCLACLPVIMFSSSAHPEDLDQAYRLGVNAFVVKPPGLKERADFALAVKQFWLRFNEVCPAIYEKIAVGAYGGG